MQNHNEELIKQVVKDVLIRLKVQKNGEEMPEETKKDAGRVLYCNYSNRHCHVSREALDALYGEDCQLTKFKDLMQPGEFAAREKITIVGPGGVSLPVRILGPVRSETQVEISRGDAVTLGIENVPVRESGNIKGSPGAVLVGPKGAYNLKEGVILAWRHIHLTPEDAEYFGVKDRELVKVRVDSPERSVVFEKVVARVKSSYALEMHIDVDEANAAGIGQMTPVTIIKG
jgi:putative phosphotransacetylase